MPLSTEFHSIEVQRIRVPRDERQRRNLTEIPELAASINQIGLINPLVVTRDLVLVAGERRFEAVKSLGWKTVPVQFLDELSPLDRRAVELEENIKRSPLSWQDHNKAIYDYHDLCLRRADETNTRWIVDDTARELSISRTTVERHLWVRREINAGQKDVEEATRFSAALAICQRRFERIAEDELSVGHISINFGQQELEAQLSNDTEDGDDEQSIDLQDDGSHTKPTQLTATVKPCPWQVVQCDFLETAPSYSGPKFNLIHMDPPYGVNRHTSSYSDAGASAWSGGYEDSPELYLKMLNTFIQNQERLCETSCHLMLWFSMNFYTTTVEKLTRANWFVVPHPLIWNKVNTGIASDPRRRPRHVYETALLASRGDRPIIRPQVDLITFSPPKRRNHYSEKPQPMLEEQFFKMLVDGSTRLLDPTCGAGSALRAALTLGAKSATGWELDEEVAKTAITLLRQGQFE